MVLIDEKERQAVEEQIDLAPLDEVLAEFADQEGAIIPILQRAQAIYGYLPQAVLRHVSLKTGRSLAQLYGVATFYAQFYLHRRGRHIVNLCDGTACHVIGMPTIISALETELGIKAGETTPDYNLTLEVVYCLGSCGLAPVAVIDGQVVGRLVPDKAVQLVRALS
jgi:NADH-quinone oxidoreductase subunit E